MDTLPQPKNPLEGAFKSPDEMAVKDVKKEFINILHKVQITYKTDIGRQSAIAEAKRIAKRSTKRYGGDEAFTMEFQDSEYVVPIVTKK